jgi:hypothetical protein
MRPRTFAWTSLAVSALLPVLVTPAISHPGGGDETGGTQGVSNAAPTALEATLTYKALKKWQIILPEEQWTPVDFRVDVPIGDTDGFLAEKSGVLALEVDTNSDGKLDAKVKGSSGYLQLKSKDDAGETHNYAIRMKSDRGKWTFSTSCIMLGKVNGTVVKLIDQNHNGRYNDYGEDAMIVGNGDGAGLLSRVVSLDDELFTFSVSADGKKVTYAPYQGESGHIDVSSEYTIRGKLIAAVIAHDDEDFYFNPARSRKALRVPTGDYRLYSGYAAKGGETVQVKGGKMGQIPVLANQTNTLEWGGPIHAEFEFTKAGEIVTVQPNLKFYGALGEEYHNFQPNAKSPKIIVMDKRTRKEVASGRFGGC